MRAWSIGIAIQSGAGNEESYREFVQRLRAKSIQPVHNWRVHRIFDDK